MGTRLLLLRHAESEWNAAGRWQGQADPPLSPRGAEQAARAGEQLRGYGFSGVVSSDLARARATAAVTAGTLGLSSRLWIDSGFREYDVGEWSGLTRPEIEARWPGAIEDWREGRLESTPEGERRDAFVARVSAAIGRVAAAHPDETILVITHGGVIGVLAHSLGAPSSRVAHLAGRWLDAGPSFVRLGPEVALLDTEPTPDSGEATELPSSGILDTGRR